MREPRHTRATGRNRSRGWLGTLTCIMPLAWACSSTSTATVTSAPALALAGSYAATTTGAYARVTFDESSHYFLFKQAPCEDTASGGPDACFQTGTFTIDSAQASIVFVDAHTGQPTTVPFAPGAVSTTTSAAALPSNQVHVLNGSLTGDGGSLLGDAGALTDGAPVALTFSMAGQSFQRRWSVGMYTDSSLSKYESEVSALNAAGAPSGLELYLNYADFRTFEGNPSPGTGITDVGYLNQNNIQLVVAFEPTNASFCTHSSITSGNSTGGCRLSDLTASAPNSAQVSAAYANIVNLANALNQPLILRFGSEMNANWDDWDLGYDSTNNSYANFIAAFEFAHHQIVSNVAAGHSVLFAFAPNNNSYDHSTFAADAPAFWPGSANVEIIGLDGYSVTNSFAQDFDSALQILEGLGSQPMMLAEFAASTSVAGAGGRKAWLDGAVADMQKNHPRVQYLNWFDSDKSHPYQLGDTDGTGANLYAGFVSDLLQASPNGN
jgi:hypothetical protein